MNMINNESAAVRLMAMKQFDLNLSDSDYYPRASESLLKEMEEFGFVKKLIEFMSNPTGISIQRESIRVLYRLQ